MPRLFAPSVSSTTMSDTNPLTPGLVVVPAAGVSGASPTGATLGFTSAIASSPFSIADPIAVPCPVVSWSIAATSALRSVVGGTLSSAKPEKITRPMRIPFGWSRTKVRAASCATERRFGWTSVEHIDRETSRARMIDVRATGTLRTTCGRPAASASATRPARRSAIGRCRCHRFRCGSTERSSATLE